MPDSPCDKELVEIQAKHCLRLAYAENRDQSPADVFAKLGEYDPLALPNFQVVAGDPSYISIADGDRALHILCIMAESFRTNFPNRALPYIAIACKHGNPCGAAIDLLDPCTAITKTMLGDPLAVMGAELMTNFPITEKVADAIYRVSSFLLGRIGRPFWGVDVVFAPKFESIAIELLGRRERRRLLANPGLSSPFLSNEQWMFRPVRGGFLHQRAPRFILDLHPHTIDWTLPPDSLSIFQHSLIIAWATAWGSNSNTIMLCRDNMLIGRGIGQQDRTGCCEIALWYAKRAGHDTKGSVFSSDGFFPYAKRSREQDPLEGPELLKNAGCIGGVVPADGKELQKVKQFFEENKMQVALVAPDHRGFAYH